MAHSHSKSLIKPKPLPGARSRTAIPARLPTISEDDRKELRRELYDFVKNELGEPEDRASYFADTYSLVSRSE